MPSEDELLLARAQGAEQRRKGMVTHLSSGQSLCPYNPRTEPELAAAWMAGFDSEHQRQHS